MALAIGLGCFMFANAIVKDICTTIISVDDIANSDGNRIQMMQQLSDFVETHSRLLELSTLLKNLPFNLNSILIILIKCVFRLFQLLVDLLELMCVVFFTWCLVVICASLLLFQMEIVEYHAIVFNSFRIVNHFDLSSFKISFKSVKSGNRLYNIIGNSRWSISCIVHCGISLWIWWTRMWNVLCRRLYDRWDWLVLVSDWNTTNVASNYDCCTEADLHAIVW